MGGRSAPRGDRQAHLQQPGEAMSHDGALHLAAFRAEMREFVRVNLSATVREKVRLGVETDRSDDLAWVGELRDRG